jgi:ABC-2 type transport system permease protein
LTLNTFDKYIASIVISIRQQLAQRGQLLGRTFLYLIIVCLFHQVFQSVNAPKERLWYLAITEWIALSTAPIAFQIAQDIRSGQIVYFMLRPLHYLALRFYECMGVSLVRFTLLGVGCIGFSFYLTGFFPTSGFVWIMGTLFSFLSVILFTLLSMLIGLFSFWLKEIQPLIYLNLTMTFCFGGLIVPLGYYSNFFKKLSFCTPYPWILWWPADYMTGGSAPFETALLAVGVWIGVISIGIIFLYKRCLNSFVSEGG